MIYLYIPSQCVFLFSTYTVLTSVLCKKKKKEEKGEEKVCTTKINSTYIFKMVHLWQHGIQHKVVHLFLVGSRRL